MDARLLTSEERGGIRRIELTHDILTSVARRSRDARLEREAAPRRRRQRTRFIGLILGLALLVAGVSVPLAVWALREERCAKAGADCGKSTSCSGVHLCAHQIPSAQFIARRRSG